MTSRHDRTAIVPFLRNELPEPERQAMAAHLAGCAECREAADQFRAVLGMLAAAAPPPPAVHWGRYHTELRARLGQGERHRSSRWWPVSVALSAALAAILVFLAVERPRDTRVAELGPVEETVIGAQLELLRDYPIVERLELLENLDVIRDLDELDAVQDS